MPAPMSERIETACPIDSGSASLSSSQVSRSVPSTSSITKYGVPTCSPSAWMATTFGCETRAIALASVWKRSRMPLLETWLGATSLMATRRSRPGSSPL